MKKKLFEMEQKAQMLMTKTSPKVLALAVAFGTSSFACADAKKLMEDIIGIIAMLITALAVIMAVVGIVNYASAHSEGDGPAQSKAVGKIAAGVMLAALSIILKTKAGDLVGNIDLG